MRLRTANLSSLPTIIMMMVKNKISISKLSLICLSIILFPFISAYSQGTIFGTVSNSDFSTPENETVYFFGYLDDTDEEIRIEGCIGAGYDGGYWFDDFQNYLTEAPDNPFDFHFFNSINGEGAVLSGLIPSNSYHQEDIQLTSDFWPDPPTGVETLLLADSTVKISWNYQTGLTYRIYRRMSSSDGSFYRIDDPSGSTGNPGVDDSLYIDNTVDNINEYDYIIIALDNGIFGRYSDIVSVQSNPNYFLCGDTDGNGIIQIFDITYLLAYLYLGGPAPVPLEAANCNGLPELNIFDITYLIAYLYLGGPDLDCPEVQ